MCRGIVNEKRDFASLFGDQFDALPEDDQDDLINEHFIPPHIQLKYANQDTEEIPNSYPVLKVKCGQKFVELEEDQDEVNRKLTCKRVFYHKILF